jgi:hypothetical protein
VNRESSKERKEKRRADEWRPGLGDPDIGIRTARRGLEQDTMYVHTDGGYTLALLNIIECMLSIKLFLL